MSRSSNSSPQIQALRMLADELEAGTRELSPEMAKALAREIVRAPGDDAPDLSREEWEEVWGVEIDARLESYRAGTSQKQDLGAILDELRPRR